MINSEHNLTVDDLIVEYMIFKVKNGYEPQFLASEFIEFLHFFESKMPVQDILYESEQLFQRFFERKAEHDWHRCDPKEMFLPHMEMMYSKDDEDYIIKANYKLSDYDLGCLNTYYMPDGKLGKGKTAEIRKLIGEFLSGQSKRKIDETIEFDENSLMIGKCVAAKIVEIIWRYYIKHLIESRKWQLYNMNEYLFNNDLAEILGLKSIKQKLLDFYEVISKRIAILYQQDKDLKISSRSSGYLARANYELLIDGFQYIFEIAFGEYKKTLDIDLATLPIKENDKIDKKNMPDKFYFPVMTITQNQLDDLSKLVRTLDGNISKN